MCRIMYNVSLVREDTYIMAMPFIMSIIDLIYIFVMYDSGCIQLMEVICYEESLDNLW